MAGKYSSLQWATGVVGSAALRSIVRHPRLELVGVKVYSDDKKGRDADHLVGIDPTGKRSAMPAHDHGLHGHPRDGSLIRRIPRREPTGRR